MSKSDDKYWINSGKFTLIERVSMLVFGVLTFYLIVRDLDKIGYGTWMLFISIHALLDTARSGFFKNPLIRFLNKVKPEEQSELQAASLLLNLLYSLVSSLLLLLIAQPIATAWDAPGLVPLMEINVLLSLVLAFFSHFEYIQAARFRFKGPMLGNLVKSASFCAFVAYYYFSPEAMDLITLAWGFVATTAISTIVMYWHSRDIFAGKLALKFHWAKMLFNYGKYTLGTNLSAVFMRNVDTWMLGWYISPAAVAIYNVAIRIANLFEVPTMALAAVLFPQAVKKAEEEGLGAVKELYEKSVAMLVVMLLPLVIGVIVFSDLIVEIIAGPDYAEAGIILNITMLYGLIIPFNKQLGILLDAVGKAKTNMFFVARNAIINGVLNAIMIPMYGITGAAYATLITMVAVMFINQVYLKKTFNVSMLMVFKNMGYYTKEIPKKLKTKFL